MPGKKEFKRLTQRSRLERKASENRRGPLGSGECRGAKGLEITGQVERRGNEKRDHKRWK